ncbi:MAG: ATP synthase F1 subunit gamma [Patescibacteria group bacterium]
MAVNKKIILRRIRSVKNTRKITKAMELVSAAKMKRSTEAVIGSRPYVEKLRAMVARIAQSRDISEHPLLVRREGRERVLLLLVMSDRGLCGGYNVQLARRVRQFLAEHAEGVHVDVIAVGKRAGHAAKRLGLTLKELYTNVTVSPTASHARPMVRQILEGYSSEVYDDVFLAYTDFRSAIHQVPRVMTLLPMTKMFEEFGTAPTHVFDEASREAPPAQSEAAPDALFEPDQETVLDLALTHITESMVYQALLESSASEHSARRMAMQNASEAALEMIDALTLTYNQARQAAITQEIAEISSGKAALE